MPKTTDMFKAPFDFVDAAEDLVQGEYEKGIQESVSGLTMIAYPFARYFSKKASSKEVYLLWLSYVMTEVVQLAFYTASSCGTQYDAAAADLDKADEMLSDATAESGWTGDAADAYNDQVNSLRTLVQTMSDLDSGVAAVLALQSDEVERIYQSISELRTFIQIWIPICMFLNKSDPPQSELIQALVFTLTTITLTGTITACVGLSNMNAETIAAYASQYSAIGPQATTSLTAVTDSTASSTDTSAEESDVSEFAELATVAPHVGSDVTEFDGSASVASSDAASTNGTDGGAPVTGSSGADEQSAALLATTASTGSSWDDAVVESPSDGATAYPMPAFSRVASPTSPASTPATASSGSAASVGGASERASAKVAAVEEGVGTADVDGAAAGSGHAERAPIDVETGRAEQAPQQSSVGGGA